MKTILIVDTASPTLVVIVSRGKDILAKNFVTGSRIHATYLNSIIDKTLNDAGVTIKQIDEFIIGTGPGSYTGLRAGLMSLKMFSFTLDKPLYQINSFSLLSSGYNNEIYGAIRLNNHSVFCTKLENGKLLTKVKLIKLFENKDSIILFDEKSIKISPDIINDLKEEVLDINSLEPDYHVELKIWFT